MNNTVMLIGRICNDLELRTTQSGINVLKLNIAIQRTYKNSNGEYDTDFINCTLYRQIAERTAEYCKKGDLVAVRGSLQTGSYTNKEGKKVYTTEVAVEKISFLQGKTENKSGQAVQDKSQAKILDDAMNDKSDPFKEFGQEVVINDSDLPF